MHLVRLSTSLLAALALASASPLAAQPAPPPETPVLLCDIQVAASGDRSESPVFDEDLRKRGLDRILRALPFGKFAFAGESCQKIKVGEKIRFDLQDAGRLWVARTADEGEKLTFEIRQEKGEQTILAMKIGIKVSGYQTIVSAAGGRTLVQLLNPRTP